MKPSIMSPLQTLSVIYFRRKALWEDIAKLSHLKFLEMLEIAGPVSMVTEALQRPDYASTQITEKLLEEQTLDKFSSAFGLKRLFCMESEQQLLSMLDTKYPPPKRTNHGFNTISITNRDTPNEIQRTMLLSTSERKAIKKIQELIGSPSTRLIHWSARKFSGANFLVSMMHPINLSDDYDEIIFISPTESKLGFEHGLSRLGEYLELNAADFNTGKKLWIALRERKALLVVKHAEYLPSLPSKRGNNELVNALLQCKIKSTVAQTPRIMLVGDYVLKRQIERTDISSRIPNLQVGDSERFTFFLTQLSRFERARGYLNSYDEAGFRPKRAKWQIGMSDAIEKNPIDIRMRALFCSNKENFSYFDPTAGFEKLVGILPTPYPMDVEEYLLEARLYIDLWSNRKRRSELQVLRWLSTGVYWLTDSMMKELRTPLIGKSIKIDDPSFQNKLSDIGEVVSIHKDLEDIRGRTSEIYYTMPLALKSIIQDHWKKYSAYDRALTHYKVAKRLFDDQNDKALLDREFPYQPHWGRVRHYFLNETIRHLIRACEQSSVETESTRDDPSSYFPKPPDESDTGSCCNPSEVLRFCYEVVFHNELNGNTVVNRSRTLSYRHGAYHMVAEILQLFSRNQLLGEPHNCFPTEHTLQYYEEVAFACLDLGQTALSTNFFTKALDYSIRTKNSDTLFRSKLNLSLSKTVSGNADELVQANNLLSEAEKMLSENPLLTDLSVRIMTRKAHILTIEKRYEVALEIYRALEKRSIQRDVAVYYIKALLGSNVKKNQSEALEICLENIFNSNSKGHHHEGLIFRVLLSNIFRSMNLLEVAERNMDLVQSDILNYGCSERTFLAFLLEAGIILNCQERYTRAYAMFLKPCLLRAHNRSLSEYKSEAKYQATHSLMSLKDLLHTSNDIHYKQNIIRDLMTKNEFSCTESKLNSRHRLPIDPLSSYDFVYPENTINRLCKSNGLELELSKLSKIGD